MANANPQQVVNIQHRMNLRGKHEYFIKGQHVTLEELKKQMSQQDPKNPMMNYLQKEIPFYPTPVEFRVSNVAHVTGKSGFDGILKSEQFRPGAGEFSWWGLNISKEDIIAANDCYIKQNLNNQAQVLKNQEPFLEKFTTSPPFKPSRYGNYRFTFPLSELMKWYKEQNCGGEEPVLRVYETATYKQEIMYTVLIHSPDMAGNECYKEYPFLENNELVRFQHGEIIWRAQAICETHLYQFVSGKAQRLSSHQFYVWDHVSLVFHLPNNASFKIPRKRLIEALDACKLDKIDLSGYQGPPNNEQRFLEAEAEVSKLKKELDH